MSGIKDAMAIPVGIRQTPINDDALLARIREKLDSLPADTMAVVLQVPTEGGLKAGWYINKGKWSFGTWGEGFLDEKPGFGLGVEIRKKFTR